MTPPNPVPTPVEAAAQATVEVKGCDDCCSITIRRAVDGAACGCDDCAQVAARAALRAAIEALPEPLDRGTRAPGQFYETRVSKSLLFRVFGLEEETE